MFVFGSVILNFQGVLGWLLGLLLCWLLPKALEAIHWCMSLLILRSLWLVYGFNMGFIKKQSVTIHEKRNLNIKCLVFSIVNQDLNFRLDGEMVNFPLALVPSIVCRFQLSL